MRIDLDRTRGSLVGLAVGDALGAPIEFKSPGNFELVTDMRSGGTFNLQAGQYTDDTVMALCLAESILQTCDFDPVDQLQRYLRWYRQGYLSSTGTCFDIGNTTRMALEDFERNGRPFRETGGQRGSNGAIMRLAPVPMAFSRHPAEAIRYSGESAQTTHNYIECVDACRLLGSYILGALWGETKERLLTPGYAALDGLWENVPLTSVVSEVSAGSFLAKTPPQIRGGGLAAECLEAALWAFHHSNSFEEGVLMAVNLGDDADSTGAVFGQIAGAHYGFSAIPERWVATLHASDLILDYATRLHCWAAKA